MSIDLLNKEINGCYKIVEKMNETEIYSSWKAIGLYSPMTFNLKFLNKKDTEYILEELIRFEKQILGIYRINNPNIKRIFEIDKYNDYKYISSEYVEGISLDDYINKGKKLPYKESLKIIYEICQGIEVAHRNGVIHKNLNPNNILLEMKNKKIEKVKISNFGFSSFNLPIKKFKEKDLINAYYIPPEGFGYLNKIMDERCDLYSIGIIFYRLLLGEFFIKCVDIDDVFRKILTIDLSIPLRTLKNQIPDIVIKIIKKLISKNIEDRYHSAIGLLTDLERLINNETKFDLGIEDETFNPTFDTNLVNMEKELSVLNKLLNKIQESKGQMSFVLGEHGYGKSKLIEEFSCNVFANNCVFIDGGYISSNSKFSYYGFKKALDKFIYHYTNINKEKQKKLKSEIKKLIGENIFIIKIFPCLNFILDFNINELNKTVKEIPKNYISILSGFFCNLSKVSGCLVIFLDNIQWIDNDSKNLLMEISKEIKNFPLFILMSCIQSEYIKDFINDELNLKNQSIILNQFDKKNVNELIVKILGKKIEKIDNEIFDYIYNKSMGNPFFAIETLKQLIEDEIIYPVIDSWEADISRLDKAKTFDLTSIIIKRLNLLRKDELNILSIIAVIDTEIKMDSLFKLCHLYFEDTLTIIDELTTRKLLNFRITAEGNYIYMNDSIKSIIKEKLYEGKIKSIALEIAKILEEDLNNENNSSINLLEKLYIVTKSFLWSNTTDKSIEYSIKLGFALKDIFGFYESKNYLNKALELLENNYQKNDNEYLNVKRALEELNDFTIDIK